jgi:MYXO-CTERM domain-containing protein
MRTILWSSVASLCFAVPAAMAGIIHASPIGGGIDLASGPIGVSAFGAGPSWSHVSLVQLHDALNADGVATDGKITFAALDSDDGLAMVALIDRDTAVPGVDQPGQVHMDGVSDGTSSDFSTDPMFVSPPSSTTRIAMGDFAWNSNGGGAGFAWAALREGSTITWRFQKVGTLSLDEPGTFQFVTWNGSAWSLIPVDPSQVSFSASGEFGFSSNVTVVPGPASLALLGAAGLCARRRRSTRG